MHGSQAQGLERDGIDAGQIGTVTQPVDRVVNWLCAGLFLIEFHASVTAAKGCFLNRSVNTVVFSHGKESGPWGSKITAMAAVARDLNLGVESVDYRGMDDPVARVEKLIAMGEQLAGPLLLVGSS